MTTTGVEAARKRVMDALASIGPVTTKRVLNHVGVATVRAYRANIDRGRSARGRFKKLSPRYAEWKERTHAGKPILRLSDSMYESLNFRVVDRHPRYALEMMAGGTDEKGVYNAAKVKYHQHGTATMPRRDFTVTPKGFFDQQLSLALKATLRVNATR